MTTEPPLRDQVLVEEVSESRFKIRLCHGVWREEWRSGRENAGRRIPAIEPWPGGRFSAGNGAVTHIGREEWQFGREIGPLPIPRQEAMHGESVAQVMNARAWLPLGTAKTNASQPVPDRASRSPDVPCRVPMMFRKTGAAGMVEKTGVTALTQILFQLPRRRRRQGHVSGLAELALSNLHEPPLQINIRSVKFNASPMRTPVV